MSGSNLAPLIHHYLQMFERQALDYLEAEVEGFASALHYWLYDFYLNPNPHWETSLDEFLAWQASEGRKVPDESRNDLLAQLKAWIRSVAEYKRLNKENKDFKAWESAMLKETEYRPPPKIHLIPDLPPVPRPDPPPRIVSSRTIVGLGGRYDQMVASGEYDPNILIRAAVGVLRTLFPSSEPTVHYVLEDGTKYFAIGGGPNSGDLAGQATAILIPDRAVAGATGHRVFVRGLAGAVGRDTAGDFGESVIQEATGLPVVPLPTRPGRAAAPGKPLPSAQMARERGWILIRKHWTKSIEFQGIKVFQRDDLIDLTLIDKRGRTNLQRMQRGYAPIGPDGASLYLHHILQTQEGPLAEMTKSFHHKHFKAIHINTNKIRSGINRELHDDYREAYWIERAKKLSGESP